MEQCGSARRPVALTNLNGGSRRGCAIGGSGGASESNAGFAADSGSHPVVNGTVDWICPYPVAQRWHTRIEGSQLSSYANVGQLPGIEQPRRFLNEANNEL
jgi:hypothetical protein